MTVYENINGLIGRTPMVRLNTPGDIKNDIFLKLEMFNPGGSIKDRIALNMIKTAEDKGLLPAEGTLVEPTSGNTGIGLALIGAARGYRVILTMPESMSRERRQLLKGYGADIILTPGQEGMQGAIDKARELVEAHEDYYMPQQFSNPANPQIHYRTTGEEIWKDTEGRIDYFIAGVGTGGTLTGAGGRLKEKDPHLKVVAVEPAESPVISGGDPGSHKIQGLGAGFIPENLDTDLIDRVICVDNQEAMENSRWLARTQGILAGISAGAAIAATLKLAREAPGGASMVTIIPDTGERYLSTELWDY